MLASHMHQRAAVAARGATAQQFGVRVRTGRAMPARELLAATAAATAEREADLIGGPASVRDSTVLISGGGFSGLAAAVTLVRAGVDTLLVEQGRGLGGRVCTRRVRGKSFSFDHGLQYFAPKPGSEFASLLAHLDGDGVVARWAPGRLGGVSCGADGRLDFSAFVPHDASKVAFVGVPTMGAVGRHVLSAAAGVAGAGSCCVAAGTRAAPGSLTRDSDGMWLVDTHPKGDPAAATRTRHRVVLAAGSASSTFNVIAPVAPQLAAPAGAVRANACWGLMVAFETPLFGAAQCVCDGALVSGSDAVAWFARDSSKPGRDASAECWVVHAAPEWSNARRSLKAEAAAAELLQAFMHACGVAAPPAVAYSEAHRWNAAYPLNPAAPPDACFADASLRLAMAGEWCVGPRAGDAWASGAAAARAVLRDML